MAVVILVAHFVKTEVYFHKRYEVLAGVTM